MTSAMPKVDSLTSISPSSTMELLPTEKTHNLHQRWRDWHAQEPPLRTRANSIHHHLEVRGQDGAAVARGGSALVEEGETFIAHLGLGGEAWGEPVQAPSAVCLPQGLACSEVAAGDLHSLSKE